MTIPDRSHEEVTPILKPSEAKPWNCRKEDPACTRKAPCRSCLGRRNRRSGMSKQRAARKALGIPANRFRGLDGNEENWLGPVRLEVKSGALAGPVWTKFLASEKQAEQNKRVGDPRPFVAVFMPKDVTDGAVVIRLSKLREVVEAFAYWEGGDTA